MESKIPELLTFAGDFAAAKVVEVKRGEKFFEWSNHLGNVLATVSDRKIAHTNNSSTIDYYEADLVSVQDYYPFGMIMPGRAATSGSGYRYGFNGQEKEREINPSITSAEFWMYDGRLGRRWNQDPKPNPSISNYACFAINPIWYSDAKGDTIIINGSNKSSFTINTTAVNSTINLSDYGFDHDFKGNYSIGLDDLKPDAIGIDLSLSGSAIVSGTVGLNLVWHTRGEKSGDAAYPELHTYTGKGVGMSVGANANVGVFFAWATNASGTHASDDFVANGVNWTGNFWSAGVSLGNGWASGSASYFTGRNPAERASGPAWSGIQFSWSPGLSVGSKTTSSSSFLTFLQKANSNTLGLNFTKTYYYMMYGNGSDYLDHQNSNPADNEDVSGWNFWNPIDPKDNYKK